MADPFEVRLRFTDMLAGMSASTAAAHKAAQYLLKNKAQSEDLHSCILEQIEQIPDMNVRANILCFIEVFLDAAAKDSQATEYITMMQRDLPHIMASVAPHTRLGQVNLPLTKLVVQNLITKKHLPPATETSITEWLASFDAQIAELADPLDFDAGGGNGERMGRRQADKRMEEDRERHKRLRESIWAVPTGEGDPEEWEKIWEETSDIGEDDYRLAKEEGLERESVLGEYCEHWRERLGQRDGEGKKEDVEMVTS